MTFAKFASLAGTALESNVARLGRPYKLNFCVTYMCQSRCLTCNIWQMRPKGELTIEEIRDFARRNGYFKWVELTGGEPFLRGDIVEIAKAFKEANKDLYILTMPTNSLCNPAVVEKRITEILQLGIPRVAITVSLDGYRELHDKIRGVPGNYDKAIGTFKMLKRLKGQYRGLFFVFGYTMSKFNIGEFQRTFEEVRKEIPDIRYNDFHINLAQLSENYYNNAAMEIAAEREKAAQELAEITRKRDFEANYIKLIEDAFLRKLVEYARTGKSPMRSRSLEASLYLDSFGNVFPSIMWNRKIGNIRDVSYDLMGMWHGEEAAKVRKEIKEGKEPAQWTSCEAYQMLTGNIPSIFL